MSLSKTPSPPKDRIYGSKVNPKGSASSEKSAQGIKLSPSIIIALTKKLNEFKETYSTKKVSLSDLKAVYRRGLGAYSKSHRPTISGGKPNTRNAWAMARVNAFLRKASGGESKKAYVQDDDLLKMHLGGDMSKHLAPNGKPSNLTHEQWHLVRTPEFKAWFGDWEKLAKIQINDSGIDDITLESLGKNVSKVVDENGEPLVVYQGSEKEFYKFTYSKSRNKNNNFGNGFYFTNIIDDAKKYGNITRSFFLKINNINYLKINKRGEYNPSLEDWQILKYSDDFDGLLWSQERFKNLYVSNEKETYKEFVVYKSNQIKLANGKNTTFDANNPDIRYADGGEVNDCINYIKDNQTIFDNGYYFDMNDLSNVIDPYGQVPLNLDFTLVTYNSGGQNNLDVINTINPTMLVDKLSELLGISKNQSYVVVHYVIDKAKRLTNINQITTEKIVVVDRDMVVCQNLNQQIKCRRCGWEWNTKDSEEFDKYVCHNCGFDNRTFYDKEPIGLKDGGETEDRIRRNQKKYLGYDDLPQSPTEKVKGEDTLKGRYEYYKSHKELFGAFENGGEVDDKKKIYEKWKSLVNMSYGELKKFYDSEEGKKAGLSSAEANKQGISNGRESARWVMKMKTTPKSEWTPTMWKWANKQISFISRMSGNQGDLYDDKGNKTRKHTSLLIWGHNPKKSSSMKYAKGGSTSKFKIYHETLSEALDEAERYIEANGYYFAEDRYFPDVTNGGIRYGETKSISRELDGKRKNTLLAQIYRMDSGRYELNMYFAYEGGGQMDVRMEDTIQRMDDPNFADISYYMRGGKIDWTEFYKDGGMNKTCEKFDKNGERKIDMKSIEDLTYCVNKLPQTKEFHFHDGQYDADRKKLHKEIIYKIKKDLVCVESDKPIAILMGGSPASGKSTFLKKYRPYLLEEEILKVDADEIRSQLPEYKGFNATQTHLETKDIVNLLLSDRNIGIPCRFDLIYDGTMNNTKSYLPLIALLKSLGYRIYVVYIDNVPKDVIVNRALERYKRSGRFVPLEVIDDFFTRGKSALNEIKKEVDGYMIVDGKDSNYHVIEKGGMQLPKNRRYSKIGEPIKITSEDVVREYKRGGELNPDDTQLKNEVVHKSGKVGGMLVGKRHSEGGIKAINKSTGQPLEMEGGEVVITRNAVSDDKKRMFEGKMMTNKEILSKINESGGGVSFAKGGNVKKKDDCCCGYESGGNVKDMKSQYPKDFKKGLREELREHSDTFMDLKRNKISLKEAAQRVVAKHLSEKPNYYKNYKQGGYLTFADKQIPSLDAFVKGKFMVDSPFVDENTMYSSLYNEETKEHKYHRVDDKKAKPISDLLAYETYLYDNFGILFSKLPIQVQNALTLGKQALIDNYINS